MGRGGLRGAGIQQPVNRRLGEVLGGLGVSTMGNTAGTTGTVFGPVALVGVSGVSLSQSTRGNQATISIAASAEAGVAVGAGTQTQATGTVVFSNSNGVTFGLSNGTLTASAAGGAAPALSAGSQLATSGTVVFSNSNGVTFGLSNSSVLTASYSQSTGPAALAAGTQTASSGTVVLANSNGITFGLSGSSQVTASHNAVSEVGAQDFGGGAGINLGIQRWVWASNATMNVAFTKSIGAGASSTQASILAHAQAVAAAAGTQTATSGTVVFSNSNGVTFGLSNSSVLTASYSQSTASAVAAAAGTQTATSGTVVFSNSNGVTFGMSNSSVVTASYSQSTASAVAVAAGTQTATSGTVVFSNSNGVTFGLSNSSVLTASYSQSTGPAALAAGSQTGTSGTFVFSNSAIEFGMSGSSQITAQPKRVSYLVNNGYDRGVFLGDISANTAFVFPWYIPAPISATRLDVLLAISNSTNAGGTVSMDFAIYTLSGSTANALVAVARSFAYNATLGSNSSYTQVSGTRYRSMNIGGGINLTPGQYLVAFMYKLTTGSTSGTYQAFGGRDVSIVGNEYPNALGTTQGAYWNGGFYSNTTATALPNPIQISEVISTGFNDVVFVPFMTLAGSF